ncbi:MULTISPECIES: formylmethanofuran dehydrogenase subunit C [unclassified Methanoculleus]|uniref:formylmethanofuran dehydrogenase subunit C n=1 Tax=unclassified Methanoculleus TaxID=2619537 RepID=UPI0025E634AC|nr:MULTISPECIES: formylmethanofuran dehydrogenase subunit C [unclassified Methanoculleus]MCK9318148.1 formylmethanofuran dehydrogenase subunit C [Methanoculleus sp.]MDD2254489.1 formylmethanofuran dehydrogenase subunit C [Methanoculleus sp.]MDD2787216.1 formylmethanofuran dehydrogenase subunit C [Methanoculleus sp.]MDD3216788.1 formylmethanofuran dehydrogenase subunit C [Methanoculleus sp.]MDD4314830.1 formylmethanofuran dehydrogenase subunit C [Methanoculleus sp.]
MKVTLAMKPTARSFIPIEAESIVPKNFLAGTDLVVWRGNRELRLDEVFTVTVEGHADRSENVEVVLSGDDTFRLKRVGEYMEAGKITVLGNIGMHCGNFMTGGEIEVRGNADGWLGREMGGGTIICRGDAADYCASGYRGGRKGMTGGTVEVFGRAGDFVAEHIAGGTVIIHGSAGDMPGAEMHGGTLTVHGDCSRPAANMKGGSCYVFGTAQGMLPTFRKIGTVQHEGRTLIRFVGDVANRGKGNLFVRDYVYLD